MKSKLHTAQTYFIFGSAAAILLVIQDMVFPQTDSESFGFAMLLFGFPILAVLSGIIVVISLYNTKSLKARDWFIFSGAFVLLMACIWLIGAFFFGL